LAYRRLGSVFFVGSATVQTGEVGEEIATLFAIYIGRGDALSWRENIQLLGINVCYIQQEEPG
jgi:hypothetical protein